MSWRAVRESEKRATGQGGVILVMILRPSLMANNSAVTIEAVAGNLQAVAVALEGMYMADPTDVGSGIREPSV